MAVFTCDARELALTVKNNFDKILEKWPRHGHGIEFRCSDEGAIVLDLLHPEKPMTVKQIKLAILD
jgi:hypothetical protein